MDIVVPGLIIFFIIALVLTPYILDAWFINETNKLNFKKEDEDEGNRDN